MRVLVGPETDGPARRCTPCRATPWCAANMVSTVDGAATGEGRRSGAINNAADKGVFDTLRGLADAVVVGAGTARAEGYRPAAVPIVLVSRSGGRAPSCCAAPRRARPAGDLRRAPGLDDTRAVLGDEHVLVLGEDTVDLGALPGALAGRGCPTCCARAGRTCARDLLAAGRGRRAVRDRGAAAARGAAPADHRRARHRRPAPAAAPRGRRHPARTLARRAPGRCTEPAEVGGSRFMPGGPPSALWRR